MFLKCVGHYNLEEPPYSNEVKAYFNNDVNTLRADFIYNILRLSYLEYPELELPSVILK
jgi:hypothetical protein